MALVVGWLEEKPALDQLTSLDTVIFLTCASSSVSVQDCKRRCHRRHLAFRLAPISTGRSNRPGSRASRFRLSFVKHEVIPADDFCELNCINKTLEVAIIPAVDPGPVILRGVSQVVCFLFRSFALRWRIVLSMRMPIRVV